MLPPWPPPTLLIHSSSILHPSSSSDIILHPSFILSILFLFLQLYPISVFSFVAFAPGVLHFFMCSTCSQCFTAQSKGKLRQTAFVPQFTSAFHAVKASHLHQLLHKLAFAQDRLQKHAEISLYINYFLTPVIPCTQTSFGTIEHFTDTGFYIN